MFHRLLLGISLATTLSTPITALAKSVDQITDLSLVRGLSENQTSRAIHFKDKYKRSDIRPQQCPLQSNSHQDILKKLRNVKTLMNGKCHELHQSQIDDLLTGIRSVQEELDKQNTAASQDIEVNTSTNQPYSLDGFQIQTVMNSVNGLNNIFLNNYCSENRPSFLATTADVISSFAQLGVLAPNANGLIIAGVGTASAAILRAIDNLLKPQFDFEDDNQRETFIKLNCAFYDLRRDIEESGFTGEGSLSEEKDLKEIDELIKSAQQRVKSINKQIKETQKTY